MSRTVLFAAIGAAALTLAACEAKIGKDDADNAPAAKGAPTDVSAEGKAKEGQFSIDAPGFALKFDIPEGIADHADVESDSDVLYPGAELSGMHIQAGDDAKGRDSGSVELRFTSVDAPGRVAAWYRDPARAKDLTVSAARREGDGFVIEGKDDEGDPFKVIIGQGANGGTDGRLVLSDKG